MRKTILASLLVLSAGVAFCQEIATVSPHRHSGGLANDSNNRQFAPSKNPIQLEKKELSPDDRRIADQAERLIDRNATTAILLIEKGRIVFEKYKDPASQSSPLFSQSMSKSLTAYTVGEMHCAGKIGSLSQPVKTYANSLQGTAMGNATVVNVLAMSSGVADAVHAGSVRKEQWNDIRTGRVTIIDEMKKYGKQDIPAGQEFRYNSLDTFALSEIGDQNGGFFDNFEKTVWQKARTENTGYWLHDTNKQAMSNSGFSATARDWARLAMYTIQEQKSGDACMKDFMKAATTPQIKNSTGRIGKAFKSYGYQTWVGNFQGKHSYWWAGYGGQRVGIDPITERVLVVTSWREDYMPEIYDLFKEWQRK
jgi:CubicO group peptidase (beta-lactamase class C family)